MTNDAGQSTEHTSYTINGREATPEERAKIDLELKKASGKVEESKRTAREMGIKAQRLAKKEETRQALEVRRELSAAQSEMRKSLQEARREINATTELDKDTRLALSQTLGSLSDMRFDCDGSSQQWTGVKGKKTVTPCLAVAMAGARSAIAQARASIERMPAMSESDRAEALRDFDEAMAEISAAD